MVTEGRLNEEQSRYTELKITGSGIAGFSTTSVKGDVATRLSIWQLKTALENSVLPVVSLW